MTTQPAKKKINRHYKHAKKIMKWKGSLTPKRANMAIDEVVLGMKETIPKYKRLKNGMIINIHDMLA